MSQHIDWFMVTCIIYYVYPVFCIYMLVLKFIKIEEEYKLKYHARITNFSQDPQKRHPNHLFSRTIGIAE